MKYDVNIKNEKSSFDYLISVQSGESQDKEVVDDRTNNEKNTNADPFLCYQIALAEYEHCIKRMERLDNKIYILLTVCAFIFVMLTNAIGLWRDIRLPENDIENGVVFAYGIGTVFASILVLRLLARLINSLSAMEITRFDSFELVSRQMHLANSSQVVGYVIAKMEKARDDNNKLVSTRYKKVDCCVRLLIVSVITLVALSVIGTFAPRTNRDEMSLIESIFTIDKSADKGELHEDIIYE